MLDILICSLKDRLSKLNELKYIFEPQVKDQPVSILVETDSGEMAVGAKRNKLVSRATRKYVAFVDDDDTVAPNYVSLVLDAIKRGETIHGTHPDCIGMCGYVVDSGQRTWQFRHSVTVANWCKDKSRRIYFRSPNHLNPIRRDIVTKCPFPEKDWGEDKDFSDAVKWHCRSEVFIETPIYFYSWRS